MWDIKDASNTLIYLKCSSLYLTFHRSWIEDQRFQQSRTLSCEVLCQENYYPSKIQQAVAECHHYLYFQKIMPHKIRVVWGFFFLLLYYAWRIFFFFSFTYARTMQNKMYIYKCEVKENRFWCYIILVMLQKEKTHS